MDGLGKPLVAVAAAGSILTAFCYSFYHRKQVTARSLQDATKLHLDENLKTVLMNAPGKCLPYAVIEGAVKPVKETLNSQFVEGCKGVIQRLVLQEHKMVWNRTTHIWNDCEKIIHQRTNTVPFDLVPTDGNPDISVRVIKPLDSSELNLETMYEKFHPVVQTFTDIIGHFISGERPKGVKETEEMLRDKDIITGVGELVLDSNIIKIQPPKQGLQYYLSRLDFESLVRKQESKAKLWKILTMVFGITTCISLFFILRQQYKRYIREQEQSRLQREMLAVKKQRLQELDLTEEQIPQNACAVCLSRERSSVFLECGHVCSCTDCYEALPIPKKCPICRNVISRLVPLYNS
ncbi:mitochondrial ubiquitin ligase activator of NFKB 1 [Chiloscyllium punctatum]|uniref:mitochondrial ubiquitin ligase activator of NFKB 1 n=1 Tax=Chiloscyllium punctatum TaxID=137246 RepID=UPI003B63DF79